MKKIFFILVIILPFSFTSFSFASFFIPRTIVIERSGENKANEPLYLQMIPDVRNDFILQGKSFLEVNLSAMLVKLYGGGRQIKEWPILKKGDPQGWGGSPLGLYEILSKQEVGFSTIAGVYMPFAMNFYGKYYIHGEPYYPGGQEWPSDVTGGCIQLSNKDVGEIYGLVGLGTPVLVVGGERDAYQFSSENLSDLPEISAESYLAADLDSGFVFAEKKSQELLPIASLAKLMASVVVAENVDLRNDILVRQEMLELEESVGLLEAGKRFRVVELFYPLLIESSNDAAEVLSRFLGRERTVAMMNEKAKSIFMEKTEFSDPQGYGTQNISTAQDLFRLAEYVASSRPPLMEISRGGEVRSFGEVRFGIKEMAEKNIFAGDASFSGGTAECFNQSECNALFVFKLFTADGTARDIAIILLGSEDYPADAQKINNWLLKSYSLQPVPAEFALD